MTHIQLSPLARRIGTRNNDRLKYVEGGGVFLTLFGLPFLCAGLFAVGLFIFRLIPRLLEAQWTLPDKLLMLVVGLLILAPLGVMFTFAGVSAVFSRDVAVIDRKDRTVSSWRSILWFRRPTSYNLGDFSEIAIERRIRRGALGSSYPVFAVVLTGQSETIEVVALRTRAKSERVAREIGEFLEGTLIVANQR